VYLLILGNVLQKVPQAPKKLNVFFDNNEYLVLFIISVFLISKSFCEAFFKKRPAGGHFLTMDIK